MSNLSLIEPLLTVNLLAFSVEFRLFNDNDLMTLNDLMTNDLMTND